MKTTPPMSKTTPPEEEIAETGSGEAFSQSGMTTQTEDVQLTDDEVWESVASFCCCSKQTTSGICGALTDCTDAVCIESETEEMENSL